MRTTLDIDNSLMQTLLDRHPGASKTDAVEKALRAYLESDAVSRLIALAGTFEIDDIGLELRRADHHT